MRRHYDFDSTRIEHRFDSVRSVTALGFQELLFQEHACTIVYAHADNGQARCACQERCCVIPHPAYVGRRRLPLPIVLRAKQQNSRQRSALSLRSSASLLLLVSLSSMTAPPHPPPLVSPPPVSPLHARIARGQGRLLHWGTLSRSLLRTGRMYCRLCSQPVSWPGARVRSTFPRPFGAKAPSGGNGSRRRSASPCRTPPRKGGFFDARAVAGRTLR